MGVDGATSVKVLRLKIKVFRPGNRLSLGIIGLLLRAFFVLCLTVTAAACAAKAPPNFLDNPFPLLVWLGEFTRPAGTVYPQLTDSLRFGSLSGLAPDPVTRQWVGVSDDRDRSRLAFLNVGFGPKGLEVAPVRLQELRAGTGVSARLATQADLEAIVALPNGTFLASE